MIGPRGAWRPSPLTAIGLPTALALVLNLATNTVTVSAGWWPPAVWGAAGTLLALSVTVESARLRHGDRSDGEATARPGPAQQIDLRQEQGGHVFNSTGPMNVFVTERPASPAGPHAPPPKTPEAQAQAQAPPAPPAHVCAPPPDPRRAWPWWWGAAVAWAMVPLMVLAAVLLGSDDDPDLDQRLTPSQTVAAERCGLAPDGPLTTVLPGDADGACYGFVDSVTQQESGSQQAGFGRDATLRSLQYSLLKDNPTYGPDDLTVVWLGNLTCGTYRPDGSCVEKIGFAGQAQQLQGLAAARATDGVRIRVVIASAGYHMAHADDVAKALVAKRNALGRVVVIGGDESRAPVRDAITTLTDNKIPVIATTLTGDLRGADKPFLPEDTAHGYLQFLPPNTAWAREMVRFIKDHTPRNRKRDVIVYHAPSPGDEHTDSLADDVGRLARAEGFTTPPVVQYPTDLGPNICAVDPPPAGGPLPAAVVYVDRSEGFGTFVQTITRLCPKGPAMLVGNDALNGVMSDDDQRKALNAPWPMAYFALGNQCTELWAAARANPGGAAFVLLNTLRSSGLGCREVGAPKRPGDAPPMKPAIGVNVSLTWDAVWLAKDVVLARRPADGGRSLHNSDGHETSNGMLDVADDRLRKQLPLRKPLCVYSVSRPADEGTQTVTRTSGDQRAVVVGYDRRSDYCDEIY